jgi:phage terminase small subunit
MAKETVIKKKAKNKISKKIIKESELIISDLNENQKAFCREYIFDWNGTRAYQTIYKCEYKVAMTNACRLLRNAKIKEYIELTKNNIEENCGISKTKVVAEHIKLAFSSIAHLHNTWIERKDFEKLTPEQKECIQEIETKIQRKVINKKPINVEFIRVKLYSKQTSLIEISKLLGYNDPEKLIQKHVFEGDPFQKIRENSGIKTDEK